MGPDHLELLLSFHTSPLSKEFGDICLVDVRQGLLCSMLCTNLFPRGKHTQVAIQSPGRAGGRQET